MARKNKILPGACWGEYDKKASECAECCVSTNCACRCAIRDGMNKVFHWNRSVKMKLLFLRGKRNGFNHHRLTVKSLTDKQLAVLLDTIAGADFSKQVRDEHWKPCNAA